MTRIFVTGSADGLGRGAAAALLEQGHQVVVHARGRQRLPAMADLVDRGAVPVFGDLSSQEEARGVAEQVNGLGGVDAVIHNAGVNTGADILAVNVIAPYLLTALIARPLRLVYLSSGMHYGGRPTLAHVSALGTRRRGGGSVTYSDSKLFVTTLAAAVARLWPDVYSNAVDPGWVPTRMGGPGAPDDLTLGHVTQVWLAAGTDPRTQTSGKYWHHQQPRRPHPAVGDERFQDELLDVLAQLTGTPFAYEP